MTKQAKVTMPSEEDDALKQRRTERSELLEVELRQAVSDPETSSADRAEAVLIALGDKLVTDLDEQFDYVKELRETVPMTPSRYAEAQLRRLLRMMQKRKELLDRVQAAMVLGDDIADVFSHFEHVTIADEREPAEEHTPFN